MRILRAVIFVLAILVLVSPPAPTEIGLTEVLTAGLVFGGFLYWVLFKTRTILLDSYGRFLCVALLFYVFAWLVAACRGAVEGVDGGLIFRSFLPQIIYLPAALFGLSLAGSSGRAAIAKALIAAGTLHCLYMLFLGYIAYAGSTDSNLEVNRITFMDPRTTLPLLLAVAALPLPWLSERRLAPKVGAGALVLLSIVGALATQTRAQILAIAVVVVSYAAFYLLARPRASTVMAYLAIALCTIGFVMAIPKTRALVMSVIQRQQEWGDNARVDEEWLPALDQWARPGSVAQTLFGIGLGQPVMTKSSGERTYVHNQAIYTMVYTGVLGFSATALLYGGVLLMLLRRFFATRDFQYAAMASLFLGLTAYGELFAVHKIFAYNFMIFAMAGFAVMRYRDSTAPAALEVVPT